MCATRFHESSQRDFMYPHDRRRFIIIYIALVKEVYCIDKHDDALHQMPDNDTIETAGLLPIMECSTYTDEQMTPLCHRLDFHYPLVCLGWKYSQHRLSFLEIHASAVTLALRALSAVSVLSRSTDHMCPVGCLTVLAKSDILCFCLRQPVRRRWGCVSLA